MHPLADPRILVGTWRVDREIDDRRAGELHRVDGDLTIESAGDGLTWQERLVWHRPDGDADVRRRLLLAMTGDGWWVRFEDGRDFHPWRPGEQVLHPCGPDTYAGVVDGTPTVWTVTWEVTGPGKDYTMVSALVPTHRRAG